MQFRIPASEVSKTFRFALLTPEDFSDDEFISNRDGESRLYEGKPAYRTNLIVTDLTGDEPRQLQGTTVKVYTKPAGGKVQEGLDVRLSGDLLVTPWVNYRQNNNLCYSIVAEGFASAKAGRES